MSERSMVEIDPLAADLVVALMEQNAKDAESRGNQMLDVFDRQVEEIRSLRAEVGRLRRYEDAVMHMRDVMFPIGFGEALR